MAFEQTSPAERPAAREEERVDNDFGQRYLQNERGAAAAVERFVCGTDYGVCGYTTLDLADRLLEALDVSPADTVLDIGTGCGWPALRAASERQGRVVGADLPLEGLVRAMRRAGAERVTDRYASVRCSARQLPFRRRSFDVILHTDVLC